VASPRADAHSNAYYAAEVQPVFEATPRLNALGNEAGWRADQARQGRDRSTALSDDFEFVATPSPRRVAGLSTSAYETLSSCHRRLETLPPLSPASSAAIMLVTKIPSKVPAPLQWSALSRQHVERNRGLRDIDAQFEQLAVDPRSAPQRVLNAHSLDQVAHLFANPWPAAAPTGFPPPNCRISHAMPMQNRLGPDDGYGVKNARETAIEPNEQSTVYPTQTQSPWGCDVAGY
jgi:hypothetical protein